MTLTIHNYLQGSYLHLSHSTPSPHDLPVCSLSLSLTLSLSTRTEKNKWKEREKRRKRSLLCPVLHVPIWARADENASGSPEYQERSSAILWLNANSRDTLLQSLTALARYSENDRTLKSIINIIRRHQEMSKQ